MWLKKYKKNKERVPVRRHSFFTNHEDRKKVNAQFHFPRITAISPQTGLLTVYVIIADTADSDKEGVIRAIGFRYLELLLEKGKDAVQEFLNKVKQLESLTFPMRISKSLQYQVWEYHKRLRNGPQQSFNLDESFSKLDVVLFGNNSV